MVKKTTLLAVILAVLAGTSRGETSPAAGRTLPAPSHSAPGKEKEGKGTVRLEEMRITGSPERPGVLFFLPRPRFQLLPPGTETEGSETFLREDAQKGALKP